MRRPAEVDRHARRMHRAVRAIRGLAAFRTHATRYDQGLATSTPVIAGQIIDE